MLIRNTEIVSGVPVDVRIAGGKIVAVGSLTASDRAEATIDAGGGALLPGLHDHHLHLHAFAAALGSVKCGPPVVYDQHQLIAALRAATEVAQGTWIRGIGYHESVAGDIDRTWLDRVIADRPVRVQHRTGRLWILNSAALDQVASETDECPLERSGGQFTGRLLDGDSWLRRRIGSVAPPIRNASRLLLSRGVTGITDTTPVNGEAEYASFAGAHDRGDLVQDVLMMGTAELESFAGSSRLQIGARKLHLHEADLPSFEDMCRDVLQCHRAGRAMAVHCVTLAELIFTLGAFEEAGSYPGDRIEHASVTPLALMPLIAHLGLTVVTQPNFISERGDQYLKDVALLDQQSLYRQRAFIKSGIPLAGGTDAPFGDANPWSAMQAAVTRRTRGDEVIGIEEALSPEEALSLFCSDPLDPGRTRRRIALGAVADLCLLDRPWAQARSELSKVAAVATFKAGEVVWREELRT